MTVQLRAPDAKEALRLFDAARSGGDASDALNCDPIFLTDRAYDREDDNGWSIIDEFSIGSWASSNIEIEEGYNSELNGPFLQAFLNVNKELLRIYAFTKYGNDDNRNLTQEDLDYFQFRVKVSSGSSNFSDNLPELLEKLGKLLIAKMSGTHAVVTILGFALIGSTAWGTHAYIEGRKEVDLATITAATRKSELETQQFTTKSVTEQQAEILHTMKSQNEIAARMVEAATNMQQEYLKAASKTGPTVIGDIHLNRDESRDLVSKKRSKPQIKVIEQDMRVVGGNTGSDFQTAVILEDPITLQQYKISFSDPILSERNRRKIFDALEKRSVIWVKLSIKEIDGEVRSAELIDLPKQPKERTRKSLSLEN